MASHVQNSKLSEIGNTKPSAKAFLLIAIAILFSGLGAGFGVGLYSKTLVHKQGDTQSENTSDRTADLIEAGQEKKSAELDSAAIESSHPGDIGQEKAGESEGNETSQQGSAHVGSGNDMGSNTETRFVLGPVITNIATPSDVWIRLEAEFKVTQLVSKEIGNEIQQDFAAFFRTLRLEDLEGGSAYNDLKAELLARANVRSGGSIEAIYFKTFLFE